MTNATDTGPSRGLTIGLGILFVVGGLFLLGRPGMGSVAVTLVVGWSLLFAGIASFIGGIVGAGSGSRLWSIIGGALFAVVGISLITDPMHGTMALTTLFTIWLIVDGVFNVIAGVFVRELAGRGALILVGLVSLVLGVMLANHYPSTASWVLGTYAGVVVLMRGFAYLFMGADTIPASSATPDRMKGRTPAR